MAGTEIVYKNHFYDYCGNYCTVNIYKDDFTGAETEVTGGSVPCTINLLGEGNDKFEHFKSTEAVLNWMSATSLQFLNLFLSPNKTYRVCIFRGIDPIWSGWVNPEFYSEPLAAPPYEVSISVTDGLALLKNIPFPVPSPTTYNYNLIYYLATCLSQISIDPAMTVKVASNLSILTSFGIKTYRVLEYAYIDWRTFADKDSMRSCWDVMEEILTSLNARVFQYADSWWIEHIDGKQASHRVDIYSLAGAFSTFSTMDNVVSLTAHTIKGVDIRFSNRSAVLEVQPAYRGYSITQEYGQRENLLNFSNFEGIFKEEDFISTGIPAQCRYWTVYAAGPSDPALRWIESETALQIDNKVAPLTSDYIYSDVVDLSTLVDSQTNFMAAWAANEVQLNFRYKFKQNIVGDLNLITNFVSNCRLVMICSGNTYYFTYKHTMGGDKLIAEWTTDPLNGWISVNAATTGNIADWYDVDIKIPLPPSAELGVTQTSVTFQVWYQVAVISSTAPIGFEPGDGMMLTAIQLQAEKLTEKDKNYRQTEAEYSKTYDYTIDANNLLEPQTYEFKYGDTPYPIATDGDLVLNKYVLLDGNNNSIRKYGFKTAIPPVSSLHEHIAAMLELAYRRPLFKLKGDILDSTYSASNLGLGFNTILKDYDNRYYFPTGLSYNMKESITSGEWMQMWDDSGTGEFNDDFSDDFFT